MKKPEVNTMYTVGGKEVPAVDNVNTREAYEDMMDALIEAIEWDGYDEHDVPAVWLDKAKQALKKAGVKL